MPAYIIPSKRSGAVTAPVVVRIVHPLGKYASFESVFKHFGFDNNLCYKTFLQEIHFYTNVGIYDKEAQVSSWVADRIIKKSYCSLHAGLRSQSHKVALTRAIKFFESKGFNVLLESLRKNMNAINSGDVDLAVKYSYYQHLE